MGGARSFEALRAEIRQEREEWRVFQAETQQERKEWKAKLQTQTEWVFVDQARDDAADALGFSSWTKCHDEIFREAQGSVRGAIAILKHRLDKTGRHTKLSRATIDYLWKNHEREAGNVAADSTGVQREGVRQVILHHTPQQDTKEHLSQLYHFRLELV